MKIIFKVIDVRTGEDITNNAMWCLRPDGSLAYNMFGDLIGDTFAKALITVEETNGRS